MGAGGLASTPQTGAVSVRAGQTWVLAPERTNRHKVIVSPKLALPYSGHIFCGIWICMYDDKNIAVTKP